jgi:hypothetical protein
VNHIRYSSQQNIIVSSGVEKKIKCWTPFDIWDSYKDPIRRQMGTAYSVVSGELDSIEEDLFTLYQFDMYVKHAQNKKAKMDMGHIEDGSFSDDSDHSVSFLQEVLNVAMLDWV